VKKVISIIISAFLLLVFSSFALAAPNLREQEVVTVGKGEIVNRDFFLAGGDIVEISGVVNGDVVIAGGQLTVDGVVNGDVLAAGGSISISGEVSQDVRVAGGQITISGKVGRNLTVAGGNIEVTSSAEITGGGLFAGGNVTLASPFGGDVYVGAGNLTISNEVNGDVNAGVGSLRLSSGTKILGDLTYVSDADPLIDSSASVSGQILRKDIPESDWAAKVDEKKAEKTLWSSFRVVGFLSALLFGLLMLRYYPNHTKSVASTLSGNFLRSTGVGFLVLIIAPLASLFLMITIIGFPLGGLLGFAFMLASYVAKIFAALALGTWGYKRFGRKETMYMPFILGLLAYYIITMIPFIGGLIAFVVLLSGLGATYLSCRILHEKALKAKII
jgi:cytoskeletal protein CcmA (bactofilin family)